MPIRETYMNKKNRDIRYKELVAQDLKPTRYSYRGQNCHPMYVRDYEKETGIVLTQEDKGFGNTIYKTYFSSLYIVETNGGY